MRITQQPGNGSTVPGGTAPLIDNYGRTITYLRLAITDRCNLRCRYCMPEQGIVPMSHHETLSYEELERVVRICLSMGVKKVRVTGGEPFARRGCIDFLQRLKQQIGVPRLYVTTNGVETATHLQNLKAIGIDGLNVSLDTLDRERFEMITRRDRLPQVLETLYGALSLGIVVKINSVIDDDTGDGEILALVELTRSNRLSLRFIEKMPFSGTQAIPADPVLQPRLHRLFPGIVEVAGSEITTARLFQVPGFAGTLGIIEGHSRRFCASCNKIRITPRGMLKTCLYDNGVLDLRDLLRSGWTDSEIAEAIRRRVSHRFRDGHATEQAQATTCQPSMSTIGG